MRRVLRAGAANAEPAEPAPKLKKVPPMEAPVACLPNFRMLSGAPAATVRRMPATATVMARPRLGRRGIEVARPAQVVVGGMRELGEVGHEPSAVPVAPEDGLRLRWMGFARSGLAVAPGRGCSLGHDVLL